MCVNTCGQVDGQEKVECVTNDSGGLIPSAENSIRQKPPIRYSDQEPEYGATTSWPYTYVSKLEGYDNVNKPEHYNWMEDITYEPIKVIHAWSLSFNLGNAVKYICRAGKKDKTKLLEDLKKARFYINYEINRLGGQETDKRI